MQMMQHVLTLISDPRGLPPAAVATVVSALEQEGVPHGEVDWLASSACDLPCAGDPARVARGVGQVLADAPIDVAVQPSLGRRKRLLVADLESTLIQNEMLDELAEFVGKKTEVKAITARAMNGEIDFRAALRERVALLAGLPASVLTQVMARLIWMPGAHTLVATLRQHGVKTALLSGGFSFCVDWVKAQLGFEVAHANHFELAEGRLTGRVHEPILGREDKRRLLLELCAEHGFSPQDALAVGDGANDLPMLLTAGLGVAFRAKPRVAAAAPYRIVHGDLTALLFLQGYRESDLTTPDPH